MSPSQATASGPIAIGPYAGLIALGSMKANSQMCPIQILESMTVHDAVVFRFLVSCSPGGDRFADPFR